MHKLICALFTAALTTTSVIAMEGNNLNATTGGNISLSETQLVFIPKDAANTTQVSQGHTFAYDNREEETWIIKGGFGEPFDCGPNILLNREIMAVPRDLDKGNIKEILIHGFKNGNVIIRVEMKRVDHEVRSALFKLDLMDCTWLNDDILRSKDKNRLAQFLAVFVDKELIPQTLPKTLLSKINAYL